MATAADVRFAWAAGLFTAQGGIELAPYEAGTRREGLCRRRLLLAFDDEEVVRRFCDTVGCGKIRHLPAGNAKWSDRWRWECYRWVDIEPLLVRLLPHLGAQQAERAKAMLATPPGPIGRPRKGQFRNQKAQNSGE